MGKTILVGIILSGFVLTKGVDAQLGGIDAEFAGAGARPLSMGGAFLGLADDSTAAEFNPAGMRVLRRPEVALQVTHTFDERDEYLPLSSLDNGVRGEDRNEWSTPSFFSYVHPGQKYTWAITQLTNIDFIHEYQDAMTGPDETRILKSHTEATNNAFGLTIATDLCPRLHLGLTLRMNRFDYLYEEKQFVQSEFANQAGVTGFREFTDWSPSVNLGVLWRASQKWSFGSVYKSGQVVETSDFKTSLPQTFGIGTAYHPNDRIRLLADVDYITWSDFDSVPSDTFKRSDVMRYHLGGEYLFCLEEERAWFVRCGLMREDANAMFYDGPYNPFLSPGFPQEDDRNHVSLGLGLATEKYQVDLAVDQVLSDGTMLILSMIKYF